MSLKMSKIRVEVHTHTSASSCSTASQEQVIARCKQNKVDVIAITDHNTTASAYALQKAAPDWLRVIIGEEVSSLDGEIVGLFLRETIPGHKLTALEVISEIKKQGGISMLPHPFDYLRGHAIKGELLEEIAAKVDVFEVFNARCVLPRFNIKADEYAEEQHLRKIVGSDAHLSGEFGNAVMEMDDFGNPEEFLSSLQTAGWRVKYASPFVHFVSKWNKIKRKF